MKYIKDICMIIIAISVVAFVYNRWDIGRYELETFFNPDNDTKQKYVIDTKTSKYWWWNDRYSKWSELTNIKDK